MLATPRSRSARWSKLVAGSCLAACLLASCGGGDGADDQAQIEVAVRKLQHAFAAEDTERVCALLSRAARKHIEGMGHDRVDHPSGPCYFDLYMFIEGVQKSPTWRKRTMREVSDVVVNGDKGKATVRFEDGQTANLPLVRERGQWRVDALYGGIPAEQQEDNY